MGRIVFILGGVRSGKSRYAQERALEASGGGSAAYIATAEAQDTEMRERVLRHRAARPANWITVEAPLQAGEALGGITPETGAVIVDCLTLLMSNLILRRDPLEALEAEREVMEEIERVLKAARASPAPVFLVSNEVGHGVVPPSELGRVYRDIAGRAHQRIAAEADEVVFLIAGIPQRIK